MSLYHLISENFNDIHLIFSYPVHEVQIDKRIASIVKIHCTLIKECLVMLPCRNSCTWVDVFRRR